MRDLSLVGQFYALIIMNVRRVISECLRKRMVTKARSFFGHTPIQPKSRFGNVNHVYGWTSRKIIADMIIQGHPTTTFCKISVRRSKYCLEFSITWGRLRISRWPFHSWTIFEFPTIFWRLIFHISLPRLGYFPYSNGNVKFSESKMWWREESEKFSLP